MVNQKKLLRLKFVILTERTAGKDQPMKVSKVKRITGTMFFSVAVLWLWYMVAADYGYWTVSGTYVLQLGQGTSTLVLLQDKTFKQEINHRGKIERSEGNWYRFGEGGIEFSSGFLMVSGREAQPDGKVYAQVEKEFFGLIPYIALQPESSGHQFRRKILLD